MGVESYMGTPLFGATGKPLGLLAVLGRTPLPCPALAESVLKICAARAAAEVERLRSEEALREKTDQLQAITDAMASYLQDGDWRAASRVLLNSALSLTGSQYGFAGAVTDEGTLRTFAFEGVEWDRQTNREFYEQACRAFETQGYLDFTNLNNLFGRVITDGAAVLSNDPAHDPRAGGIPPGHPPLRCFLGVPMLRGGQVVGMIGVANRPGGYSAEQQHRLEVLTRTAGVLYDNYRRQQREQAHEREMQLRSSVLEQMAGSVVMTDRNG